MSPSKSIEALDLSHHDTGVDFSSFKVDGIACAWLKSSEGDNFNDPKFFSRVLQANKAGFEIGAYHYFLSTFNASAQARFFHNVARDRLQLQPAFDLETAKGMTAAEYVRSAAEFVTESQQLWRCEGVVYSYPWFWDTYLAEWYAGLSDANKPHLWMAEYPNLSTKYSAAIHQYHGGQGGTDHDRDRILRPLEYLRMPGEK